MTAKLPTCFSWLEHKFHYANFPGDVYDKPVIFPLAQIPLCRLPRNFPVWGSFREVGITEFGLKGTSRVCRGRHGEVSIVEFVLKAGTNIIIIIIS